MQVRKLYYFSKIFHIEHSGETIQTLIELTAKWLSDNKAQKIGYNVGREAENRANRNIQWRLIPFYIQCWRYIYVLPKQENNSSAQSQEIKWCPQLCTSVKHPLIRIFFQADSAFIKSRYPVLLPGYGSVWYRQNKIKAKKIMRKNLDNRYLRSFRLQDMSPKLQSLVFIIVYMGVFVKICIKI